MKLSNCFGVLAVACLALSTPLLAGNEHNTFNGGIGVGNPCNGLVVSATGPVDVVVETNTAPATPLVSVHLRFKAEGSATNGDVYKLSFMANSNFDAVAPFYDVPFHAVFVGKGNAPNFSAIGSVRVFVNGAGVPVGAHIVTFSSTCTQ
jgi:hypothetical protein